MRPDAHTYIDRRSGQLKMESVYAERLLDWAYNTGPGRLATDFVLSRKWVSRLYGWVHGLSWSRRKITRFAEDLDIDLSDSVRPIEDFRSFNDFFTREIDLSRRQINADPAICVSPVDGRLLAYQCVDPTANFAIKRGLFNLSGLLGDQTLAGRFADGAVLVCRLYLTDYHHFHFPDSGVSGPALSIKGKYHAVSPYAHTWLVPFYAQNARMLTLFDSHHFGRIAMIEIGAMTVGSIRQKYRPGWSVAKGERKGWFELGGSTVVLVFEQNAILFDADLCANSAAGIETYVHLGESVGRAGRKPAAVYTAAGLPRPARAEVHG